MMKVHVSGFWKYSIQNPCSFAQNLSCLMVVTLLLCDFLMAGVAHADHHGETVRGGSSLWQELKDGFDYMVRVQGSGRYLKPAESSQNPENEVLKLKQYRTDFELRPDFYLTYHRLDLMAKPRARLSWIRRIAMPNWACSVLRPPLTIPLFTLRGGWPERTMCCTHR